MKRITQIFLAIIVAVTFINLTGCGTKPPVRTSKPVQPTPQQLVAPEPKEEPSFRIESVSTGERKVIVAFPITEAGKAIQDSVFQVYAASFVYADGVWHFQESADGFKVYENIMEYPYIYGYITLPFAKYLTNSDWYGVRVWVKTEAGTRLAVQPDSPYYQENEAGVGGYNFYVNMTTGENHPVKRE